MDTIESFSSPLPLFASIPLALVMAVMVLLQMWKARSLALRFVLFAIGFRLLLSAFFFITFRSSPFGISWNALGTILVFVIGLAVVKRRRLLDLTMTPIYVMVLAVLLSGLLNREFGGMVGTIAKYGYFAVLMLSVTDALEDVGTERLFKALIGPVSIPFAFQILSILLGVSKAGESDGSISYIGGYNHEAVFSVALGIGLLVLAFARNMNPVAKGVMILWCCVAIQLANYRTAVVALLPLIGIVIFSGVIRRFPPRQRGLISGMMIILLSGAIFAAGFSERDRYADIGVIATEGTSIIKPPRDFSPADKDVMSGRAYIWSEYIYGYRDGSPVQHIIGMGPDAWAVAFRIYAHNSLVSALFDLGLLGVAATLLLWLWMLGMAMRVRSEMRFRLIAAHLSFILLGMATMPLWMVEGLMFYGILCGYTLYCVRNPEVEPSAFVGEQGIAIVNRPVLSKA